MVKVTFTLDDHTIRTLRKMAQRTRKPQSLVVREAIAEYAVRGDRLSMQERDRLLTLYDQHAPAVRGRPAGEIDRELRGIRQARRRGRRGTPSP